MAHYLGSDEGPGAAPSPTLFAARAFFSERVRFDVKGILANDDSAVIFGDLASKVNATGRIIESPFALILYVADGKIARFQMLEDSFAVSRAARS